MMFIIRKAVMKSDKSIIKIVLISFGLVLLIFLFLYKNNLFLLSYHYLISKQFDNQHYKLFALYKRSNGETASKHTISLPSPRLHAARELFPPARLRDHHELASQRHGSDSATLLVLHAEGAA